MSLKVRIIILLVFCFLCASLGGLLALRVGSPSSAAAPTPLPPKATSSASVQERTNLVIIQVNDLRDSSPRLVSVWYGIILLKQQPSLTFKPLYPSQKDLSLARDLQKNFSLNANGQPKAGFLNTLQESQIPWDAWLIFDSKSGAALYRWALGESAAFTSHPPESPRDTSHLDQDRSLLNGICDMLSIPAQDQPRAFDWDLLTSDHFVTSVDVDLSSALGLWHHLSDQAPRCKIHP